jgi:hypothetical protein
MLGKNTRLPFVLDVSAVLLRAANYGASVTSVEADARIRMTPRALMAGPVPPNFHQFGYCVLRIDKQYACLNLLVRGIWQRLFISRGRSQIQKYAGERPQHDHYSLHRHGNAPIYFAAVDHPIQLPFRQVL